MTAKKEKEEKLSELEQTKINRAQMSENFLRLQARASEIEDAISDRREFFNESVNMYNIGIHEFPNLILAKIMAYNEKSLLVITEQEKKYDGIKF